MHWRLVFESICWQSYLWNWLMMEFVSYTHLPMKRRYHLFYVQIILDGANKLQKIVDNTMKHLLLFISWTNWNILKSYQVHVHYLKNQFVEHPNLLFHTNPIRRLSIDECQIAAPFHFNSLYKFAQMNFCPFQSSLQNQYIHNKYFK